MYGHYIIPCLRKLRVPLAPDGIYTGFYISTFNFPRETLFIFDNKKKLFKRVSHSFFATFSLSWRGASRSPNPSELIIPPTPTPYPYNIAVSSDYSG